MKMRGRKRLAMRRTEPVRIARLGNGRLVRIYLQRGYVTAYPIRRGNPITFPPPADTWGIVTGTIGPFVPLPIRRDIRFERRMARMRDRIKAALVITED